MLGYEFRMAREDHETNDYPTNDPTPTDIPTKTQDKEKKKAKMIKLMIKSSKNFSDTASVCESRLLASLL